MRRHWWRIALPAAVLLLFAAAGGALWALTSMPSLMADALTRALGRRVEVGSIEVNPYFELEVEVRGLRVYSGSDVSGAPLLEAPIARGSQSWARVLVGQLVPGEWELQEPVARLAVDLRGAGSAALPDLPLRSLRVLLGRVEIDAGADGRFQIEELSLDVARRTLLPGIRGRVRAKLHGPAGRLGRIDVDLEQSGDALQLAGDLSQLALGRILGLPGLEGARELFEGLTGAAGGSFALDWRGEDFDLTTDVALKQLQARMPGLKGPIEAQDGRLAMGLTRRRGVWTARPGPVRLDDFEVAGEIVVDPSPRGRVRADLEVAPFSGLRTEGRETLISLGGLRLGVWRYLDEHLQGGRFESVDLVLDVPYDEFPGVLDFGRPLAAEELRFAATVSGGSLLPAPDYAPLERISGRIVLEGDRLRVERLAMSRRGRALPVIDLELNGFSQLVRLPREELRTPEGPGVGLPGLRSAFAALRDDPGGAARRDPPDAALELVFRDLWLGHPALLLQIRDASGRIRFTDTSMQVEGATAVVAGGLARLDVTWRYLPARLRVGLRYLPGPAPPRAAPEGRWLSGQFAMERVPLGRFVLHDLSGELAAERGTLRLDALRAELAQGRFSGAGRVDLTREDSAPIDFSLRLEDADASEATAFMALESASVTGVGSAELTLGGALVPGTPFVQSCALDMRLELRNGTLVDMPIAMQIARLPSLEGIRGLFGQALPYDTLRGQLSLREGVLDLKDFSILSPQLRALVAGQIDLTSDARESDLLIAFLFLQTLDRVLRSVPYVGELLLGDDGSLLALSFRVRGPFASPSVTPAPPATLQNAADWTGGWLRRMRKLIPGMQTGGDEDASEAAPEGEREEDDESARQDP